MINLCTRSKRLLTAWHERLRRCPAHGGRAGNGAIKPAGRAREREDIGEGELEKIEATVVNAHRSRMARLLPPAADMPPHRLCSAVCH
jgi:hypothetical protein